MYGAADYCGGQKVKSSSASQLNVQKNSSIWGHYTSELTWELGMF